MKVPTFLFSRSNGQSGKLLRRQSKTAPNQHNFSLEQLETRLLLSATTGAEDELYSLISNPYQDEFYNPLAIVLDTNEQVEEQIIQELSSSDISNTDVYPQILTLYVDDDNTNDELFDDACIADIFKTTCRRLVLFYDLQNIINIYSKFLGSKTLMLQLVKSAAFVSKLAICSRIVVVVLIGCKRSNEILASVQPGRQRWTLAEVRIHEYASVHILKWPNHKTIKAGFLHLTLSLISRIFQKPAMQLGTSEPALKGSAKCQKEIRQRKVA